MLTYSEMLQEEKNTVARDDGPFYHDKLSVKWMLGNNSDNLLKD